MWMLKYVSCLLDSHDYKGIRWQNSPYQYCVRCGTVKNMEIAHKHYNWVPGKSRAY